MEVPEEYVEITREVLDTPRPRAAMPRTSQTQEIMMKRWRAPQDQKLDKNQMEYGNRSPLTEKIGFWNRLYNI